MLVKDYDFSSPHTGPLINLYCIGDIHAGCDAHVDSAMDNLADIVRKDKLAYFVQLGDQVDLGRPTTRLMKKHMFVDRQDAAEQEDAQCLLWMDKIIIPKLNKVMKPERCLGMLAGDHYVDLASSGLNSTQYICAKNKIPYLGTGQALLRLNFKYGPSGGGKCTIKIHVHHGKGGGVTEVADINELQKLSNQWMDVDAFIRGHSHKPKFIPFSKYYDTRSSVPEIKTKEGFLINSGSFRKSMIMGKTDYSEAAVYAPTSTRCPIIHFTGRKTQDHNSSFFVDLSASLTVPL